MEKYLSRVFPLLIYVTMLPINFFISGNGFAWLLLLIISVLFIIRNRRLGKKAILIWLPWLIYILASLVLNFNSFSLHFTIQIIVPILLHILVSSMKIYNFDSNLINITNWSIPIVLYINFLRFSTEIVGGSILIYTSIIAILNIYLFLKYKKKHYLFYILLFTSPSILFVARTPLFIVLFSVLVFFNNQFPKRFLLKFFTISILTIFFFNSSIIKSKMLFNDDSTYTEALQTGDIRTSGRILLWGKLLDDLEGRYYFGAGSRNSYFLLEKEFVTIKEPHNDFIRLMYDYGIIGLTLYLLALFRIYKEVKKRSELNKLEKTLALSIITTFLIFMVTDNAINYTISCFGIIVYILGMLTVKKNKTTIN